MTVAELIAKLKEMPQDAQVQMDDSTGWDVKGVVLQEPLVFLVGDEA